LEHDRRRDELDARLCEPILQRESPWIEGDDRVGDPPVVAVPGPIAAITVPLVHRFRPRGRAGHPLRVERCQGKTLWQRANATDPIGLPPFVFQETTVFVSPFESETGLGTSIAGLIGTT
jgi:hypothetical protein